MWRPFCCWQQYGLRYLDMVLSLLGSLPWDFSGSQFSWNLPDSSACHVWELPQGRCSLSILYWCNWNNGITMLRVVMVGLWSITGKYWQTQEKAEAGDCPSPSWSECWGPRLTLKAPQTVFPSPYCHTPDCILVMVANAGFLSSPNIPFTPTRHGLHLIVYLNWGCKLLNDSPLIFKVDAAFTHGTVGKNKRHVSF